MHVIVVGNEKGGSGKSTTAMHVMVGLMRTGKKVAAMDLDTRQGTLTRYLENRRRYAEEKGVTMPQPTQHVPGDADRARLEDAVSTLAEDHDVLLIDTPGSDTPLSRLGHSFADTLITPMNDSFIDLDVLARVDPEKMAVEKPSQYAEMVWQTRMARAGRQQNNGKAGPGIDWIVMRNRLAHVDAHNKRLVGKLLEQLSERIGFRMVPGFGERVIYRELFHAGLTLMDLREAAAEQLSMSNVAARQEVRALIEALELD